MVSALTALVVSWLWCRMLPLVGPRLGYVDEPGKDVLKTHELPAVPLAGPGLLLATLVPFSWLGGLRPSVMLGLVLITALGVADDRLDLAPGVRLIVEVVLAAVLSWHWSKESLPLFLISIVVVVVSINAVNLYDGIDGLAGASGAASLLGLAMLAWTDGAVFWLPILLAVALAGFLPFNWHPARVFLGDGGAYLVGAVIAVGSMTVASSRGMVGVLTALGFLGMFAVDLVVTVGRRYRLGHRLFAGDRGHIYDRLVMDGWSVPRVTLSLVACHAAIVGATLVAIRMLPAGAAFFAVLAIALAGLAMTWRVAQRPPAEG